MQRRTLFVGIGGLFAGIGGITGASAFGTSATYGTVEVNADGEAVEVRKNGQPTSDVGIDGAVQGRRVNIYPEAFDLQRAADATGDAHEIRVLLVGEDGAELGNPATVFSGGLIDFRVFAVRDGRLTFIDALGPRGALEDREKSTIDGDQYLDTARRTRRAVPGFDIPLADSHGSITLAGEESATAGALVTVGDTDDVELPDLRVEFEAIVGSGESENSDT